MNAGTQRASREQYFRVLLRRKQRRLDQISMLHAVFRIGVRIRCWHHGSLASRFIHEDLLAHSQHSPDTTAATGLHRTLSGLYPK